ncbi:MAG: hypothetical protein ACYC4M_08095 [Thermoleophilia bacterium]
MGLGSGTIFIVFGASAILLTTLMLAQVVPVEEEFTRIDYLLAIGYRISSVLYIAAGLTLILSRKVSYNLFLAAIAAIFAANLNYWIVEGSSPLSFEMLMFYAPEWLALAATTVYAWKLRASGYLK